MLFSATLNLIPQVCDSFHSRPSLTIDLSVLWTEQKGHQGDLRWHSTIIKMGEAEILLHATDRISKVVICACANCIRAWNGL